MPAAGTSSNALPFVSGPFVGTETMSSAGHCLLHNPDEMRHLCNHSSNCRRVAKFADRIQFSKPQSLNHEFLVDGKSDCTPVILNPDLRRTCRVLFLCLCHLSIPLSL